MKKEIKIPDIAENVESGIIAAILVSAGDEIEEGQTVVEVETDKATTDIPSPHAGRVFSIEVKVGDEVKVGAVIMVLETGSEEQEQEQGEGVEKREEKEQTEDDEKEVQMEEPASPRITPEDEQKDVTDESKEAESYSDIPASPSVRRLARESGVDLRNIRGTGPGNRITTEDVESHASEQGKKEGDEAEDEDTGLPDFSQWGYVSREKLQNIRKITGQRMSESWQTVPHVTQYDEADITGMEEFRQRNLERYEKAGGKLTITAILIKISAFALQRFPRFNASIDFNREEIIYKHYINIGVAVDTEQGLIVPVIRDADRKTLEQLSVELNELAEKTRNKKIDLSQLQGGNFTVSNLGGIGGTGFSPIVYPHQVAILGISRSRYRQVYHQDEFTGRLMLPLSLSYDHRAVDGAEGARFLRWICNVLEDPHALFE